MLSSSFRSAFTYFLILVCFEVALFSLLMITLLVMAFLPWISWLVVAVSNAMFTVWLDLQLPDVTHYYEVCRKFVCLFVCLFVTGCGSSCYVLLSTHIFICASIPAPPHTHTHTQTWMHTHTCTHTTWKKLHHLQNQGLGKCDINCTWLMLV